MNSAIIAGLARHAITAVSGFAGLSGFLGGSDIEALAGAVGVVAATGWSVYSKIRDARQPAR